FGHGERVGAVEAELGVVLVVEGVARPAAAGPGRVAALDHEVSDHAVEDHSVVVRARAGSAGSRVGVGEGALGQADEVRHRPGGVVWEELEPDRTGSGIQRREGRLSGLRAARDRFAHDYSSCLDSMLDPAIRPFRWYGGAQRTRMGDGTRNADTGGGLCLVASPRRPTGN